LHPPRTKAALAALAITQLIGWGATFNLPAVIGGAMATDLSVSLPVVLSGPTVMLAVMALCSAGLAAAIERRGVAAATAGGSILSAIGLAGLAASAGPVGYFASWTVLGIAGTATLTTAAQIALAAIAGERAKQAIGALILFGGLASSIFWPLTGLLEDLVGWRNTVLVYATLVACTCAPLHLIVLGPARLGENAGDGSERPGRIWSRQFVLMAVSIAANGFVTWGFALTIILLFRQRGLDESTAISVASLLGLLQFAARAADFAGAARWSGLATGLAASLLLSASFLILLVGTGTFVAIAFIIAYGLASGAMAVARATMPLSFFSGRDYARASAKLALPLNLAFAAAPPVFGWLLSKSAELALSVAFLLSLVALSALLALVVSRRERPG